MYPLYSWQIVPLDKPLYSETRNSVALWFSVALEFLYCFPVTPQTKHEGVVGGCGLGGAYDPVKVIALPFSPYQSYISVEG